MNDKKVSVNVVSEDNKGEFLSLNVVRSYSVSNCNRDESGSPKTASFGGSQRARHASASKKRPMRMSLSQNKRVGKYFRGCRTMLVEEQVCERLKNLGMSDSEIEVTVKEFSEVLRGGKTKETKSSKATKAISKKNTKLEEVKDSPEEHPDVKNQDEEKKRALMFISEGELDIIANDLFNRHKENSGKDEKVSLNKKDIIKIIKGHSLNDGLDIKMFGRMAASIPEISEEGMTYVSHSISTNKQTNEINFFTAMDDLSDGKSGSAHMDNEEFNCPTMYEHITFNLKGLFEGYDHLSSETKKAIIEEAIKSFMDSIPIGKKHVMFSDTPVSYASAIRWESQPFTLVNAFEKAITNNGDGIVAPSIEALKKEWIKVKTSYADHLNASQIAEFTLGENSINDFASKVANEFIK